MCFMLLLIVIVRRSWAPVEGRHSKIWWWWWWWWCLIQTLWHCYLIPVHELHVLVGSIRCMSVVLLIPETSVRQRVVKSRACALQWDIRTQKFHLDHQLDRCTPFDGDGDDGDPVDSAGIETGVMGLERGRWKKYINKKMHFTVCCYRCVSTGKKICLQLFFQSHPHDSVK